jgi:hypothetical protein
LDYIPFETNESYKNAKPTEEEITKAKNILKRAGEYFGDDILLYNE